MNSNIDNPEFSTQHVDIVGKNPEGALSAQLINSHQILEEAKDMGEGEIQCVSLVHRNPIACETFIKNFLPL